MIERLQWVAYAFGIFGGVYFAVNVLLSLVGAWIYNGSVEEALDRLKGQRRVFRPFMWAVLSAGCFAVAWIAKGQ